MSAALVHDLSASYSFARLSMKARLLWVMLLPTADAQGRGPARPETIKWSVCPNIPEIAVDDLPALLGELVAEEMIVLYPTERGQAYQIVHWWRYQKLQWARPSAFPPPAGWTDRIRVQHGRHEYETCGWDTPGGFIEAPGTPEGSPASTPSIPGMPDLGTPGSRRPSSGGRLASTPPVPGMPGWSLAIPPGDGQVSTPSVPGMPALGTPGSSSASTPSVPGMPALGTPGSRRPRQGAAWPLRHLSQECQPSERQAPAQPPHHLAHHLVDHLLS